MTAQEIIDNKAVGDMKLAATILELDPLYVSKLLVRPKAKLHKQVVKTLSEIIENRKALVNSKHKQLQLELK